MERPTPGRPHGPSLYQLFPKNKNSETDIPSISLFF